MYIYLSNLTKKKFLLERARRFEFEFLSLFSVTSIISTGIFVLKKNTKQKTEYYVVCMTLKKKWWFQSNMYPGVFAIS